MRVYTKTKACVRCTHTYRHKTILATRCTQRRIVSYYSCFTCALDFYFFLIFCRPFYRMWDKNKSQTYIHRRVFWSHWSFDAATARDCCRCHHFPILQFMFMFIGGAPLPQSFAFVFPFSFVYQFSEFYFCQAFSSSRTPSLSLSVALALRWIN